MPARYHFLLSAGALIILLTTGVWTLSFTEEPTDAIVAAGSSVVLRCTVDQGHSSSVQYSWYKNQARVSLRPSGGYSLAADGSLTIFVPAGKRDHETYEGLYHCVVSSQQHQLWSREARVLVSRSTTTGKFGGQVGNKTGMVGTEGETVAVIQDGYFVLGQPAWRIACSISSEKKESSCPSANCQLSYTLYPIDRQKSRSVLLFTVAELQTLTGARGCRSFTLTSTWERIPSQNFLHVNFIGKDAPPKRIVMPVDTTTTVGSDVTLPCHANKFSTYTWTKDGNPIKRNSRISVSRGALHITSVTAADAGKYVCTASIQSTGQSMKSATLTVRSLPTVQLSISKQVSELEVTCAVSGSSPLTANILLDGLVKRKKTLSSTYHSLTQGIPMVTEGFVQCVVSNNYGSVQTSQYISAPTALPTTNVVDTTTLPPKAKASTNKLQPTKQPTVHGNGDSTKQTTTDEATTKTGEPTTMTEEPTTMTGEPTTMTEEPTTMTGEPTTMTEEPTIHERPDSTKQPTQKLPASHRHRDLTKQPAKEKPTAHSQGRDSGKRSTAEEPTSKQGHDMFTMESSISIGVQAEASKNDDDSGGLSSGAAAGIALACIAVIVVIVVALVIWKKQQPKQRILRDLMAGKYGTVRQNPTYEDVDEPEREQGKEASSERSEGSAATVTRVVLSRIGVDHDKASISIGTESSPVLQKGTSTVLYGAPDHITVGEDLYAVSTKSRSNSLKQRSDSEASQSSAEPTGRVLHYEMGDDEYAMVMNADSNSSRSLTIQEDQEDQEDQDESTPCADLDELTNELTAGLDNSNNDDDPTYASLSSVM